MDMRLLSILILCLGASGAHALASEDVQDEAQRWVAGAFNAPDKCRYQCDGEAWKGTRGPSDGKVQLFSELPDDYECWGLFKMWCGSGPSGEGINRTETLTGSACQGHLKVMNYSKSEEPGVTHTVIVCEGGHSWVNRRIASCPYTMKTYKKMMGLLVVGSSMSTMSYPSHEEEGGEGESPASLTPSELGNAKVSSAELAAAPIVQLLEEGAALIAARAVMDQDRDVKGNDTEMFTLVSRSHGLSVSWRGTKEVNAEEQEGSEAAAWGDLEADANEMLGTSWRDWLPSCSSHSSSSSSGGGATHDGEGPALMCNNKPAWLHGALPCWGNFSVSATRTESGKPCSPKASESQALPHSRALRAGHATLKRMNAFNGRSEVAQTLIEDSSDLTHGWSSSMRGECDGLWTGLMKSCMGVSTSHSQVMHGDELHMSKRMICSGRQYLRFIKRTRAWGMSVSCKGQSVTALKTAIHHAA